MAVQTFHHLTCGIHRENKTSVTFATSDIFNLGKDSCAATTIQGSNSSVAWCVYRPFTGVGLFHVRSGPYRLRGADHCTEDNCRLDVAMNGVYKSMTAALTLYKRWHFTLHVYLLQIIAKRDEEYQSICRALYERAIEMKRKNSEILVVAPFNQHFRTERGLFSPNMSVPKGQSACRSLPADVGPHPDAVLFTEIMDRNHPDWRSHIGYYDAGPLSIPFHDMHPEYSSTGWKYDCTHFVYSPFLLEALWVDLGEYISKSYKYAKFVAA